MNTSLTVKTLNKQDLPVKTNVIHILVIEG
jgi:hypothetical protein